MNLSDWALRFIRWGLGLSIIGLVTGYFPLAHYLMMGAIPSCPAAPVHGHTILLSFVGMTIFGLIYRVLPDWMGNAAPPLGLVRSHFWCSVIGMLGVSINGTIGYEVLHFFANDFYYRGHESHAVRNLWFAIDGVFLSLFGIGCLVFTYIIMTTTRYSHAATSRAVPRTAVSPSI